MNRFAFKSIRTKLIVLILFCGLVPLVVFSLWSLQNTRAKIESDLKNELVAIAEVEEWQVFAYMDSIKSRTSDFASDGFIRDWMGQIAEGQNEAVGLLNTHLISEKKILDPHIIGIFAMDTKGKIVAATNKDEIGKDESKDAYFIEGKKRVSLTTYIQESVHFSEEDVFIATAPLTKRGNLDKPLGVLAVIFDTKRMDGILSGQFAKEQGALTTNQGMPKTLEIYMVNKEKKMFVHPTYESAHHKHEAGMVVDIIPVKKCLSANEEFLGRYISYNKEEAIGSAMCFPNVGWTLVAEVHASVLDPFTKRVQAELVLGVLAAAGVLVVLAVFMAQSFVRPIRLLRQATRQVAEGKLDVFVLKQTQDEIGGLSENFNEMTVKLKDSYDGLEEKVKQKTHELSEKVGELEKTNKLMVGRELRMAELKKEMEKLKNSQKSELPKKSE